MREIGLPGAGSIGIGGMVGGHELAYHKETERVCAAD